MTFIISVFFLIVFWACVRFEKYNQAAKNGELETLLEQERRGEV